MSIITNCEALVKRYLKENKRIPNPYKYYRNNIGKNIRHPQQLGVVFSDNIIFRRINYDVKNMFDHWLFESELGQSLNKHPYFLRVLNYIKYRSTDFMREGFILRNDHLENGTGKLRAFEGDRKYFMKHLYVLEKLGVIIIDKRQYDNFIWINYDVVGKYALVDKHRFRYSDEEVLAWKEKNRIYDLSNLDHRAKLETLWSYQMGGRSHYDMFDDEAFVKYTEGFTHQDCFDSGFTDQNKYDERLRQAALDHRRTLIMGGNETRPMSKRLPINEFEFGGTMKRGKNAKPSDEVFNKLRMDVDTHEIDVSSVAPREKTESQWVLPIDNCIIEHQPADQIDWDEVDLAEIQWDKVSKKSMPKFKRHLVSYLDDLFVEGANESKYAVDNGVKFKKSFTPKVKTYLDRVISAENKAKYYGNMNNIFINIYQRLIQESAGDKRIRAFLKWSGKNYFNNFKRDELKWDTREKYPSLLSLSYKPKDDDGIKGVHNAFFNIYRSLLNDKTSKEQSPKKIAGGSNKELTLQHEVRKLQMELAKKDTTANDNVEKRIEAKYKAKMKAQQVKMEKMMNALEEQGVNLLDVLAEK